jgi:parallel beta-helix repeat protein
VRTVLPDTNGDGIRAQGLADTNLISGHHRVSDVSITNARFAVFFAGLDASKVDVHDVSVSNPDPASLPLPVGSAVIFSDSGDSAFTVRALHTINTPGSAAVNGRRRDSPMGLSTYRYVDNASHSRSAGLVLLDESNRDGEGLTIRAFVEDNAIDITNGLAGLLSSFTEGLTITGNTIRGSGMVGMRLFRSRGHTVADNIVSFDPGVAAMWLALTHDSTFSRNDYGGSGLPGWTGSPAAGVCHDGPGALLLQGDNNRVRHEEFPDQTTSGSQVCDRGVGNRIE